MNARRTNMRTGTARLLQIWVSMNRGEAVGEKLYTGWQGLNVRGVFVTKSEQECKPWFGEDSLAGNVRRRRIGWLDSGCGRGFKVKGSGQESRSTEACSMNGVIRKYSCPNQLTV